MGLNIIYVHLLVCDADNALTLQSTSCSYNSLSASPSTAVLPYLPLHLPSHLLNFPQERRKPVYLCENLRHEVMLSAKMIKSDMRNLQMLVYDPVSGQKHFCFVLFVKIHFLKYKYCLV